MTSDDVNAPIDSINQIVTLAEVKANESIGWYINPGGGVYQVITILPRKVRRIGKLSDDEFAKYKATDLSSERPTLAQASNDYFGTELLENRILAAQKPAPLIQGIEEILAEYEFKLDTAHRIQCRHERAGKPCDTLGCVTLEEFTEAKRHNLLDARTAARTAIQRLVDEKIHKAFKAVGEPLLDSFEIKPESYDDVIKAVQWYKTRLAEAERLSSEQEKE